MRYESICDGLHLVARCLIACILLVVQVENHAEALGSAFIDTPLTNVQDAELGSHVENWREKVALADMGKELLAEVLPSKGVQGNDDDDDNDDSPPPRARTSTIGRVSAGRKASSAGANARKKAAAALQDDGGSDETTRVRSR